MTDATKQLTLLQGNSASEEDPKGATTFTLLPLLPQEIQDMIWDMAFPVRGVPAVHAFDLVIQGDPSAIYRQVGWNTASLRPAPEDSSDAYTEGVPMGPTFMSAYQWWRLAAGSCRAGLMAVLRARGMTADSAPEHAVDIQPRQGSTLDDLFFLRFRADDGLPRSRLRYNDTPKFSSLVTLFTKPTREKYTKVKHLGLMYNPRWPKQRAQHATTMAGAISTTRKLLMLTQIFENLKCIYLILPGGRERYPWRSAGSSIFEAPDIRFYEITPPEPEENSMLLFRDRLETASYDRFRVKFLTYQYLG